MAEVQTLKTQNKVQEKQIADLVKIGNKMQDSLDAFERENITLRFVSPLHQDLDTSSLMNIFVLFDYILQKSSGFI